jgi:hypothetical protein
MANDPRAEPPRTLDADRPLPPQSEPGAVRERLVSWSRTIKACALPAYGVSRLEETAWQRGKREASELANGRAILFTIVCAPIFAVGGLFVLTSLAWPVRIIFAAVIGLAVAVGAATLIAGFYAVRGMRRQRNEARELVRREREQFDNELQAKEEAMQQMSRNFAPIRAQWQEHRETIRGLEGQVAALGAELAELQSRHFPAGEIEVAPCFYIDLPPEPGSKRHARALVFKTRVTNREPARRMNLTFDLAFVWVRRPDTQEHHTRLHKTRESFGRKYEADLLPDILDVDANRTMEGYLSFDWDFWSDRQEFISFINDIEDSGTFEAGEDGRFVLAIHDYICGESLDFDVPGTWSSG